MQGQRSALDSLPETLEFDHESRSNNGSMDQQSFWNNMINPIERPLQGYLLSPSETNITYGTAVSHDGHSLSGWNLGEPSYSPNSRDHITHEEMLMEDGWPSSSSAHAEVGPRLEERQYDPATILSLESVSINLSTNHVANGPSFLQNSSFDNIPQNVHLNAGYVGNNSNGGEVMEASVCLSCMAGGSETEQIPSASGFTDSSGTASGNGGFMVEENDGGHGRSIGARRLSCKRKALEGASGQRSLDGSPSCFQRAENSAWHAVPPHYNAASSLTISTPTENIPSSNPPEQLNSRFGAGRRVTSDSHPGLSVPENGESSHRSFRMRINPARQHDSVPLNLLPTESPIRHSDVWSSHQSSRLLPFNYSMDTRQAAATTNLSPMQSQSHVMHIPGLTRNVHTLPRSVASGSRVEGLSNSPFLSGERGVAIHESNSRSMAEHPLFVPVTETRNLAQDATNWNFANGNLSIPSNSAANSRVRTSSGAHPSAASTWLPHTPPLHFSQQSPEFVRRSLFLSAGSESGGQSSNFPPLRSGPASSQEIMLSAGASRHSYTRSASRMGRQGDGVRGVPFSLRSLTTVGEGRSRLLSEIRNVLDLITRNESLRFEDVLILDPSMLYGLTELHDRHRDMRLDVDNMSYEELLALEERIGDVSTGLSEETILKCLKQKKYLSLSIGTLSEIEPCCICQEEYVDGEDLGILDCGHDFHTGCVKQWLSRKNLCPICKMTALVL